MTATRSATGVAIALLLAVAAFWSLSRSYYVGLDGVVIYQGVAASVGPLELSWVAEETSVSEPDVSEFVRRQLETGIPTVDLRDARNVVDSLRGAD